MAAFAHSGSCCHLFSHTPLDRTRSMHPSLESFCLLPLLKLCAVRPKNFWRILFLVSLSVLGQQFCFPRRPWPVSCQHGKFLWFISQFTGICYSHSLCRLSSLSASPLLISTLVIELDVAEFHLSLAWIVSGLSMINQRTNKFLSLRFRFCFHFCLLFRQQPLTCLLLNKTLSLLFSHWSACFFPRDPPLFGFINCRLLCFQAFRLSYF